MSWQNPGLREFIKESIDNNNVAAINKKFNELDTNEYWQALDDAVQDESFDEDILRAVVNVNINKIPKNATNQYWLTRLNFLVHNIVLYDKIHDQDRAAKIYQILGDFMTIHYDEYDGLQDLPDKKRINALMVAAENCDATLVELLLSHFTYDAQLLKHVYYLVKDVNNKNGTADAKAKIIDLLLNAKIGKSYSFDTSGTMLHYAVSLGDEQFVRDLLSDKKINIESVQNYKGWGNGTWSQTALEIAVKNDNVEITKMLLKAGADVSAKDGNGRTTLHVAVENGNDEIAKLLLNAGADANAKDKFCETALHIAAATRNANVAKLLLDVGADVNAKNDEFATRYFTTDGKVTALHIAVFNRDVNMVDLLLQHNADVGAIGYDYSRSVRERPLYIAVDNGYEEIVKLLLKGGADVNKPNLLIYAIFLGKAGVAKLLLDAGADLISTDNLYWGSGMSLENIKTDAILNILKKSPKGKYDEDTAYVIAKLIQNGFKRGAKVRQLLKTDNYKQYADLIKKEKETYRDQQSKGAKKVVDSSIKTDETVNDNKLPMFSRAVKMAKQAGIIKGKKHTQINDNSSSGSEQSVDGSYDVGTDKGKPLDATRRKR